MEINKKDLKKMSRAFRTIANRTINAHYDEANAILKMFIDYIDNNYLISSYINSILIDEIDVAKDVHEVLNGYGRVIFNTGSNVEEEIAYTYKILRYIVENNIYVSSIGRAYTHSTKYQDVVKSFADRVILPFVYHIETYLTDIAIDMGLDEEAKYMITVNGGQVNIAKGHATINAAQLNDINFDELDKIVNQIKVLLTDVIAPEDKNTIQDNVEVIQEELKKENPRKGFIKTAISGLESVRPKVIGSIELAGALTSIIQFASMVIQR